MTASTGAATLPTRVLVALDGSPAAATAAPVARTIAAQLGGEVAILFSTPESVTEAEARRTLRLLAADRTLVTVQIGPDAAAAILQATRDPSVALVVLTTHGRVIEPGRPLGRVAAAVIAATEQPVLLVRPEAAVTASSPPAALRRLLAPVDGSPATAAALRPALTVADRLGAAIDLLYVAAAVETAAREPGSLSVPRYIDQPQHEWPAWQREVASRLAAVTSTAGGTGREMRTFLACGDDVGEVITRFAATHGHDAIVLARRGHLELGRVSVLRAVLDHTPCPILLVGSATG